MTTRITRAHLDAKADTINSMTKSPGHIPARQLAALMSAYIAGLYDATRINNA